MKRRLLVAVYKRTTMHSVNVYGTPYIINLILSVCLDSQSVYRLNIGECDDKL